MSFYKIRPCLVDFLIACSFILGVIAQAEQSAPPYCVSNYNQSQPNLIVNFNETYMLPLQEIFFGYNLQYMINASIPGVQLVQSLSQLGQSMPTVLSGSKVVALGFYQNTNGFVQYSLLEQIPNQINYTVRFYQAVTQQQVPDFSQLETQLYNDNMTFCTDLVFITNETIAVDCYRNEPSNGVIQTFYYLTSLQNHGQTIYPSQGNYIPYPFFSRKSISYQVDGGYYMLSYVPYGQFMVNDTEYYIDVYRYNYNYTMNDYPLGFLDAQTPITAQDLKTVDLQIVQVLALGNTIIVLDLVQGLFSFQYISNQLQNLVNIPLIQIQKAWGMALGNAAGLQNLIIVGESYVYEYAWFDFAFMPYLVGQYPLSQFPVTSPVNVIFNVDYIVVQYSNGLTDIYSRNDYFVYQELTGVQFFQLLNTDNILIYSNNDVSNFQISDPLLISSGIDQTVDNSNQTIMITATSQGSNGLRLVCNQMLNLVFYQNQTTMQIYPTGLTQDNNLNQMNDLTSVLMVGNYYIGANLSYDVYTQNIDYTYAQLQQPQQVLSYQLIIDSVFSQTYKINSTFQYFIQQDTNTNVLIFTCQSQEIWPQYFQCLSLTNLPNLGFNITIYQSGLYNQQPFWLTANNGTVYGYTFANVQNIFLINVGYPIMDVEISNELIFVLYNQSNIPIIGMYSFFNQFQPSGYITPNSIQNFPGASSYNPIQIQASLTDPGTFFAMSPTQIMVMQILNGKPFFLFNIQLNLPSGVQNQKMLLTFVSLVVIYDGPNGGIQEYSIYDYTYLRSMKNYPLYGMQIVTPLQCSYSLLNQLIYVLVQNTTQKNVQQIFVYRPGALNLNVLYTAFSMINPQSQPLYLQAGGRGADFLFVGYKQSLLLYWIPIEQYVVVDSFFYNSQYTNFATILINTNNPTSNQNLQIVNLTFLNSQTFLVANQNQIIASTSSLFSLNLRDYEDQLYNITFSNDGWFFGSVVYYQLGCEYTWDLPCSEQFQLINNFNQQTGQINSNFIQDPLDYYFDQLNTQLLYVLTNNYIYILNSTTYQIAGKPIPLNNQHSQCFNLLPLPYYYITYNLTIMMVACFNNIEQQYFVLPISFNNPEPTPSVPLYLPEIIAIGEVQAMNNFLLVQDKGRPQNQVLGSVYVYQINFANPKTQTLLIQLGQATLGSATVDITSFSICATENPQQQIIFLTSRQFALYAVTVQLSNQFNYYVQQMNASDIIKNNQMVLPQNEILNQIVYLNSSRNDSQNTYSYSILLVTQSSNLYEFYLVFNQSQVITERQWLWTFLDRIYSGYGRSYTIPDVQVYQTLNMNGFAIGYYYNGMVTIAYYSRMSLNQSTSVSSMSSGYEVFSNNNAFTFQLLTIGNDLAILCADPLGGLQQVSYSPNLTLIINMTKFYYQNLSFYPFNQFQINSAWANIPLNQILPISDDSKNGDSLWWLAIIIIVILLIIGAALYFYRKKKAQQLEQAEKDALIQQKIISI